MDADALAFLSAGRQCRLFQARELSPVDVLAAQIERMRKHGTAINAVTFAHFDEAMEAARESERRYRAGEARPLEGLTIAVKDEFARSGWTVTAGSRCFATDVQKSDHPVVAKLLDAGAILHAQATAPEFYLIGVTWSDLWGVTRNPWNPETTPGGSSGGPAALVAAGMTTLAIGSDMGGSVRIPAALCGLYGSKPAYGRIASPDPSAFVPHATPGPLARELTDLILVQNVMMGPAPGCPSALAPRLEIPTHFAERPRRLALSVDQGWARLDPDVEGLVHAAADVWRRAGYLVEAIELPLEVTDRSLRDTIEKSLFSTSIAAPLLGLAERQDEVTTYARRFIALAGSLGQQDAEAAAKEALRLYAIVEKHVFAAGYDALITPTVATCRMKAAFDPTRDDFVIAGRAVDPYSGWFLTSLFSLLNWMPVINVPAGRGANGVPAGMQIATRPYEDVLCCEIAAAYAREAVDVPGCAGCRPFP